MLDAIIAPITREEFFRDYWTKSLLHIPGDASKFSHLFPWEVLNRALEEHRFDERRLALIRSGKPVAGNLYLNGNIVNASGLVQELASGATLIFNRCEEVHRPLRDLCTHLETLFHQEVFANLYAGWRMDNGLNVHWDVQDVLILQVSGRKRWKIWEPNRVSPFQNDVVDTSPATAPSGDPVWEGSLEAGGLLNIPRGWWHVAYPLDEPCLHLTVTIRNHNGIDLLHWLAESMKASAPARMELPVIATQAKREEWLAQVRDDLLDQWDTELVSRFLANQDCKTLPRPNLSLPGEVNPCRSPVGRDTPLELALPRPIHIKIENGKASCQASGLKWEVEQDVAERLLKFNDGLRHTLAELASPDPRVSKAVALLLMKGVIRRADPGRNQG